MQVWYDPGTNEIKAVYSGQYSGATWAGLGYQVFESPGLLGRDLEPGAIIAIDGAGNLSVVTPAPVPTLPVKRDFKAELRAAGTLAELKTVLEGVLGL